MKKLYFIITLLTLTHLSQAQNITIPDVNFKNALINTMCVDTNGDGIYDDDADLNNDNEIQVSEAKTILKLKVSSQGISDLMGIEQFTNLTELHCDFNQLTSLDISKNHNLEILNCLVNNLVNLDVSQNSNLITLYCAFNQLMDLDVSNNNLLNSLWCYTNQLTSLNLKNGNNALFLTMFAQNNTNLTCIEVDDISFSNNAITWSKDDTAIYSENCDLLGTSNIENEVEIICSPNPVINLLKIKTPVKVKISKIMIYDTFGKLVKEELAQFEQLDLSNLNKGIFLVIIETNTSSFIKKIVKK